MAEPRIQYATTSDGVGIAHWTVGEGPALIILPSLPVSHAQLEWRFPGWGAWYERLARGRQVVRYDARGTGLSDRDVSHLSLEGFVLDVEAVIDRLHLHKFALMAVPFSGPVAVAYASRHPDRVSHLVLWCSHARYSELPQRQLQASRLLLQRDWQLYTQTVAHVLLGWSHGEHSERFAEFIRESGGQETTSRIISAIADFDVAELLPNLKQPTLVMHRPQIQWLDIEIARSLAARIPSSQLVLLEGDSVAPFLGDMESVASAIDEFMGVQPPPSGTPATPPAERDLRTVLFTDLVGHTQMMSRLGDERGRAVLRGHERITREVLNAHGGTEVKTMGDGFMASFGSVTRAVECAIALQRAFAERTTPRPARPEALVGRAEHQRPDHVEPLAVRVGLNAGEPIEEDGDLFGATVILASRIAAKAEGGEILVADTVRGLCSGKGFLFADRGEFVAKGFEEPVRVYEVRWREP